MKDFNYHKSYTNTKTILMQTCVSEFWKKKYRYFNSKS